MSDEATNGQAEARKNPGNPQGNADPSIKDTASKLGEQASKLGEQASAVGEQVYRQGEQVYRQGVEAGRYAARQIEEQPWTALMVTGLLSLAVGFMLGRSSVPEPRSIRDYADEYLPRRLRQR